MKFISKRNIRASLIYTKITNRGESMAFDVGSAIGYLLLDTTGFTRGFTDAKKSLKTFEDETSSVADKFSAVGSSLSSAGSTMTKAVTLPIVGIGTAAVTATSSFESAMSQVQATMGIVADSQVELSDKTITGAEAISMLEDAAKEQGATTAFSAKEAADALNYLALAGYDVEKQVDALPSVLRLAASGNMDLAYASDLVTDSMSVLGLETDQLDGYIDQMAKTASSSNTSVSQLGEAVLVAGGQATLCGMSTTELNTALGILADNGIKGSEGGTMLRNTLKNLYTPTEKAAEVLNELGIQTKTADGELIGVQDVLAELSSVLGEMSEADRVEAMANIFDTRTIAGANALINNSVERWNELEDAIWDSGGAAQTMADTQLDNLQGQLTILSSGLEGAAIAFGELLLPMIKDVISVIQRLVDWINGLDETQKQMVVTIAEVLAAIGPMLLIGGKLSSGIGKIIELVSGAGGLSGVLTALTGPIGIIIGAVAALALAWATDFGGIQEKTEEVFSIISGWVSDFLSTFKELWETDFAGIRTFFEETWQAIEDFFSGILDGIVELFEAFDLLFSGDWEGAWNGIKEAASTIWNSIKEFFSAFLDNLVDLLIRIGVRLLKAAKDAFKKVKDGFSEIWENIKTWFSKAVKDPVGTIKGIGEDLYEAGKSIFTSLWDGIKNIWESISSWVSEKVEWLVNKVQFWKSESDKLNESSVSENGRGLTVTGGGGSSNRSSGTGGTVVNEGDTYNFYSPEALTPTKASAAMKQAKQEMALGY